MKLCIHRQAIVQTEGEEPYLLSQKWKHLLKQQLFQGCSPVWIDWYVQAKGAFGELTIPKDKLLDEKELCGQLTRMALFSSIAFSPI